jgi:hypothetical protein
MDYKYMKYKQKYLQLKNKIQIGGDKILFIFFNGGGLSEKQWFEHPYKDDEKWLMKKNENLKTDIIKKIKEFGDVYLYTPIFYSNMEDIIDGKEFIMKDIDLINHVKELYDKIKDYNKFIIISHSRGWILANYFISLYSDKILGYINIDGVESPDFFEDRLEKWGKKYDYINDAILNDLFKKIKNKDEDSYDILSRFIKYKIYKQYIELKFVNNTKTFILNNIYNDEETSITNADYCNTILLSKFNYNKQFDNNINVKSIYYVGKSHFLYFFNDVVDDIIDIINKIILI